MMFNSKVFFFLTFWSIALPDWENFFAALGYCWHFDLLKVTKFLVKVSQFEFLVMAEKNIVVYKLFFSLNISDFTLFFM